MNNDGSTWKHELMETEGLTFSQAETLFFAFLIIAIAVNADVGYDVKHIK